MANPTAPQRPLSKAEIVSKLREIRFSSQLERNAGRAVSINSVAVQSGLTRAGIYGIANSGVMSDQAEKALQCLSMVGMNQNPSA